jgi:hypothetical protein
MSDKRKGQAGAAIQGREEQKGIWRKGAATRCKHPPTVEELAAFANQPLRLRFDGANAALDYARGIVEEGNNMLSSHSLNIGELYEEGQIDLVVNLFGPASSVKRQFVIHRVPRHSIFWSNKNTSEFLSLEFDRETDAGGKNGWDQQPMFFYVPELVKRPKNFIPSFIWLESFKQRRNLGSDTTTFSLDFTVKSVRSVREGKFGDLDISALQDHRACTDSLIQSRSERSDDLAHKERKVAGERLSVLQGMDVNALLQIEIGDSGIRYFIKEVTDCPVKMVEIIACISDEQARIIERAVTEHQIGA